jgi:hypothetical protein
VTTRQGRARTIFELVVVTICVVTFANACVGILGSLLEHNAAGSRDFVEYWAAGHQLVHHANPYDGEAILRLERSAGFPTDMAAQIMANPPWVLPLVLPLGLLRPMPAEILWLLLSAASLVVSVRMIWAVHGYPKTQVNFLGYSFAPALICLLAGQVTTFLLLGLVLFLFLHRSRPFLAGASLWLCMLKPHLFVPFGVVLLVWAIRSRNYKILLGAAVTLMVSLATAFALDPHIWAQYAHMMSTQRIDRLSIPCLSIMLRLHVWPHALWVQCLPVAAGSAWALTYYHKRRHGWDWVGNGSLLMLVSVLVAPYTWFMDQTVVIAALLHGAYATRSRNLIAILALASAAIEMLMFLGKLPLQSSLYLWTAPAWLAWYLCAMRPQYAFEEPHSLTPAREALMTAAEN